MPAIRYVSSNIGCVVGPVRNRGDGWVDIRLQDGKFKRLPWLGFICEAGLRFIPDGAFAKMEAIEVTVDDGSYGSQWNRLEPNQFVLCWRVIHSNLGSSTWGIYGIVDSTGYPIVKTDRERPKPKRYAGDVVFMDGARKKILKGGGNKIA